MKAVNLIPTDAHRGGRLQLKLALPTYALFGVLVAAFVLVTLYVLAGNSISERKAQIATLQSQLAQAQSQASELTSFGSFASLAQTRIQAVRGIAATRFDWHTALADLAAVVPANTSLQALNATVVPGANAGGSSAGSSTGLRADLPGPAFELTGCTTSQDNVARLISRLRAIPDVTRVALSSSEESNSSGQAGASTGSSASSGEGCKGNAPTFQITVFFQPVPGAGTNGASSLGSSTGSTTAGAGAASPAAGTSTPAGASTTGTTTTGATSTGSTANAGGAG